MTKKKASKLVPIKAFSRIMYQCQKCGAEFFGDTEHKCKKFKKVKKD